MPVVPFLPAIIGAAGSVGSALISRTGARTQTSKPLEPPEFSPLRDSLMKQAMGRLNSPSGLAPGFEATGLQNINQNAGLAQQSLENRLGGAGLLGSGIHGAGLSNLETRRFGDVNRLQNIEIPRLERDFQNQDFQSALQLYGARNPGTQTVLPGSAAGSGIGTAAELLAFLYGSGAFGGKGPGGGSNVGGQTGNMLSSFLS